jgi:hypothetical protein
VIVELPLQSRVFEHGGFHQELQAKKYRLKADPDSPLVELVHGQTPLVAVQFALAQRMTRILWSIT